MKTKIYCKPTDKGVHTFYLATDEGTFYLFNQNFRRGVQNYFSKGVTINMALDFAKANNNTAIEKTMQKLPAYIKYIEKEYEILVLKESMKKKQSYKRCVA